MTRPGAPNASHMNGLMPRKAPVEQLDLATADEGGAVVLHCHYLPAACVHWNFQYKKSGTLRAITHVHRSRLGYDALASAGAAASGAARPPLLRRGLPARRRQHRRARRREPRGSVPLPPAIHTLAHRTANVGPPNLGAKKVHLFLLLMLL